MNLSNWSLWSILLGTLCLFSLARTYYLDADSRDRRKRRRNYGKVTPRHRRPMVQLSVNTAHR